MHHVAIKSRRGGPSGRKEHRVALASCAFPYIEIEEFTSPPNEQHALARSLPPDRTSRLTLSCCSFVRSAGRISWPHVAPPFVSFRPYVHPLPRGFNVHAKQTAAPARLSIIRYIRPWPSNPSLTIPQTWRGRKGEKHREKEQKENDRTRVPFPLRQEAPKIHGATKIAATRRCRRRRRRKRTRSRVKETRHEMDLYDLSGNRLVFQRSRATAREGLSHPFVFFTLARPRQRSACE